MARAAAANFVYDVTSVVSQVASAKSLKGAGQSALLLGLLLSIIGLIIIGAPT